MTGRARPRWPVRVLVPAILGLVAAVGYGVLAWRIGQAVGWW